MKVVLRSKYEISTEEYDSAKDRINACLHNTLPQYRDGMTAIIVSILRNKIVFGSSICGFEATSIDKKDYDSFEDLKAKVKNLLKEVIKNVADMIENIVESKGLVVSDVGIGDKELTVFVMKKDTGWVLPISWSFERYKSSEGVTIIVPALSQVKEAVEQQLSGIMLLVELAHRYPSIAIIEAISAMKPTEIVETRNVNGRPMVAIWELERGKLSKYVIDGIVCFSK